MKLDTGIYANLDLLDQEATSARLDALLAEDERLAARQTEIATERDGLQAEHKAIGDRRGKVSLAVRHCRSELSQAREPRSDAGTKRGKRPTVAQAAETRPTTEEVPHGQAA